LQESFSMPVATACLPHPIDLGELTPCEAAAGLRHLPGLVFFDSSQEGRGRLSLIGARPVERLRGTVERDWARMEEALAGRRLPAGMDDGWPHGFAAGYAGYDGEFDFGFYEEALLYDHPSGRWMEIGALGGELRRGEKRVAGTREELRFAGHVSRDSYCAMVARAQEYIAAGDIYQVNLAHRFTAAWAGDPWELYRHFREVSPAPQAAFVQAEGRTLLSASPELFLQMSGRMVRTRPIKGTRPRRREGHADEKSAYDLITSGKELSELVMITDLERSDLGRVCEWGSVEVRELLALERFAHVFHLVSTVEGRLRPEVTQAEAWAACFPGGSITGAPKKRAREIIAELEPEPRGVYTGAIGWFGFNGESQFNVAIRTMVAERGCLHFHVGAGIVAESAPEREWQETLDKAAGMFLAAERWNEAGVWSSGKPE
jgi:aminodeoxychorismate synthase component I